MYIRREAIIAGSTLAVIGLVSGAISFGGTSLSSMLGGDSIQASAINNNSLHSNVPGIGKKEIPKPSTTTVHFKLAEDSGIRVRGGKLIQTNTSKGTSSLDELQATLQSYGLKKVDRIFQTDEAKLDKDQTDLSAKSGKKLKNLNTWLAVELTPGKAQEAAKKLKTLAAVEHAYPELKPVVAASPNLVPYQGYHRVAPGGSNVDYAHSSNIPGAKGTNVKVAQIEFSWNHNHEDLSKLRLPAGASLTQECEGGTEIDHGTAIASIIVGDNNGIGVTGIVPEAGFVPVSICYVSVAGAIEVARQNLSAGDVIEAALAFGASDELDGSNAYQIPVEFLQAEYDAIQTVTAAGITYVEAAGNSPINLDDPKFTDPSSNVHVNYGVTYRPGSGALMVGAGVPSEAYQGLNQNMVMCDYDAPERSRQPYSAYGSRVDVQNWGSCVYSAGYGYFDPTGVYATQAPYGPADSWYTPSFGGTSSASGITTGIAASVSSAIEAKTGVPSTPLQIRDVLKSTGTAQELTAPMAEPGNIGPLPNMLKALNLVAGVANTPPTIPGNVTAANLTSGAVKVSWTASTDDGSVAKYEIYRGGALLAVVNSPTTAFVDQNVNSGTTYSYTVKAVDNTNLSSALSSAVSVRTLAPFFTDNFTAGTLASWTRQTNMTVTQISGNNKARAFSSTTAKRAAYMQKDFTARQELYAKAQVTVQASGANDVVLMAFRSPTNGTIVNLSRNSAGKLALFDQASGLTLTSTTSITLNTAYTIQMRTVRTNSTLLTQVYVGGSLIQGLTKTTQLTSTQVSAFQIGRLSIGESGTTRSFTTTYDDIAVSGKYIP